MKKTLFILLAFALVGSFAFAEVTGVAAPTVTGSVSGTFGVDLNTNATGFVNDASVTLTVPFAGGSDTKMGKGGMYGEISISDIDFNLANDGTVTAGDPTITAKIVMGPLWIGINNPDMTFNMVNLNTDLQTDSVDDTATVDVNADVSGTGGMSVGYTSDMFSVAFMVASKLDYTTTDAVASALEDSTTSWLDSNTSDKADAVSAVAANTDNNYVFGANASVTAGPATIPVYFAYDATYSGTDALMGFGAKPSVTVAGATVAGPVDYVSVGSMNGLEADPSVSYALDGVGTFTTDFEYLKYTSIPGAVDAMNLNFTYAEGVTDAVTSTLTVGLTGLDTTLGWTVDMDNTINLDGMAPYVNFGYGDDKVFDLQVGVALTSLIDMATVTLDYTSSDLSSDNGTVTAAVSVSY